MTPAELMRMTGYVVGLGLGVFAFVRGVLTGDAALVGTGLALVGVGGTAGGTLARQAGRHGA